MVASYEPDGPWVSSETTPQLHEIESRGLMWLECSGLRGDGFEALGDALEVPLPPAHPLEKVLGVISPRLAPAIYLAPSSAHSVSIFPEHFRDRLAAVNDTVEVGSRWVSALLKRRAEAQASAKALGFGGREEPPLTVERAHPYLTALARDLVEVARHSASTGRSLYLHEWPD